MKSILRPLKSILIISLIALTANYSFAESYESSLDRVSNLLEIASQNIDELNNKNYAIMVINSKKINAWSAGRLITLTTSILKKLNDKQLMAVMLHELAHSKKSHMSNRMANIAGVNILFSLERLGHLITGKKNDKSYYLQFSEFLEQYSTIQEMQADCIAYNWLLELKRKGFAFDPLDLNGATTEIIGMDFTDLPYEYGKDLPPYLRFHRVLNGHPKQCH